MLSSKRSQAVRSSHTTVESSPCWPQLEKVLHNEDSAQQAPPPKKEYEWLLECLKGQRSKPGDDVDRRHP